MNIDWSPILFLAKHRFLRKLGSPFLTTGRRARVETLAEADVLVHNLAKGIPYADGAVDVVYHSHVLEHLDRDIAQRFLKECARVLRPGGIIRIVVPDLERAVQCYWGSLQGSDTQEAALQHDRSVAGLLEQSVRRTAFETSRQPRFRRLIEGVLLGDARRRGETHQWMYDRVNLCALLRQANFESVQQVSYDRSSVANWSDFALDLAVDGSEYKPGSLYVEGQKAL
jgi:SAM-dependent methyltransferase